MKSVLLLMSVKEVNQYLQWLKKGNYFDDNDIQRWAAATILNVYDPSDIVSINHFLLINLYTLL